MKLENQTILITSNEPWGDVWFSKHNWANELSKGNQVYFLNSPGNWKASNLLKKIKVEAISSSLNVITIQNLFPSKFIIFKELNNFILSKRIKLYFDKKNQRIILWSFTPLILFRPKLLNCLISIFHIVDLHWSSFYGTSILSKRANMLIFVSNHILNEYKNVETPKLVISHGISPDEFELDDITLNQVKLETSSFGNFGLFIGTIDERLDFIFLEKLISAFPNTNFVFIGPIKIHNNHKHSKLFTGHHKNIKFIGLKPFKILKYYIKCSSFCISPMDLNHPGNDISHHKTIPYLAQGKPIFSPIFKSYLEDQSLMYMDNKHENLIEKLKFFLKNGETNLICEERIKFAKKHSYLNMITTIEEFINE
jgi:hypothetical protein